MLIHRTILNALRFATTSDDSRYFLHGYGLDATGAIAATNGYLLLYHDHPSNELAEDYPTEPPHARKPIELELVRAAAVVTLPLEVADRAVKTLAKRHPIPILDHIAVLPAGEEGLTRVVATDLGTNIMDMDIGNQNRDFPDWRRAIPATTPVFSATIGAELLIAIGKAAQAASPDRAKSRLTGNTVQFDFGPTSAGPIGLIIPCDIGSPIKGVLMPCRIDMPTADESIKEEKS